MLELYFLKPHNVDEIAEETKQDPEYLRGLLEANENKTVTLQFETYDIPEGFGNGPRNG